MTVLITAIPQDITAGVKNIDMRMSSGDARLQISVNSSAFTDIPDTVKTSSTNFNITVPRCRIQSVITGDAAVSTSTIE